MLVAGLAAACQARPAPNTERNGPDVGAAPESPLTVASARQPPPPIAGQSVTDAAAEAASLPPRPNVFEAGLWSSDVTKIRLTWVVYPATTRKAAAGAEVQVRRIELVARAGTVAHRVATEARDSIVYATGMQRRCQGPRFTGTRVAELYMNGGGNLVYAVDREGDHLVVSEQVSTDGLCEPAPCPIHSKEIARIPVPPDARFEEVFHVVDSPGAEHDEACDP
jgi:hypothetical protein